jgi:hypothetical protein
MIGSVSVVTILLSASVSIVTGFVGALLSAGGVRHQERRIYGLALLAEIKTIHRSLWRYQLHVGELVDMESTKLQPLRSELSTWRHDLSVYVNNSGRIGLFSTRAAIEIIEFYSRIRWLDSRIAELGRQEICDLETVLLWLADHQQAIRSARQHSRYLGRLLRREVPATPGEIWGALRRRRWRRPRSPSRSMFLPISPAG